MFVQRLWRCGEADAALPFRTTSMSTWRDAAAARFGPAVAVHATPGVEAALAAAAGLTPAELLRPAGVRVDLNGEFVG